jgi:hypothetical protein
MGEGDVPSKYVANGLGRQADLEVVTFKLI